MKAKIVKKLILSQIILSIFLCMLTLPVSAQTDPKPLDGLKISILGDSISSFENISSGKAAQTSNSTIANNNVFYRSGTNGVALNDTWWMQVIDKLGGEILVNNSYSRSTVFDPEGDEKTQGYYERCVNLHDNTGENAGEEPDIIIVYMGINDFSYCREALGSYADIDFQKLIQGDTYIQPTTTCEAYAIMLHKLSNRYPDAEVYCFTLPAKKNFQNNEEAIFIKYNNSIKQIAERYGCIVVDAYNDTGILKYKELNEMYLADGVHPNKNGMDALTASFINAFNKNSRYINKATHVFSVDYILSDVIVDEGTLKSVCRGDSFKCTLTSVNGNPVKTIVISSGKDITDTVLYDNMICIPEVTDDITVIATADTSKSLYNYSFTINDSRIVSSSDKEFTDNKLSALQCANGTDHYYKLSNTVALKHTENWSLVWEAIYSSDDMNNIALYNYDSITKESNVYIKYDPVSTLLSIGIYKHGNFCDYGAELKKYNIDTSVSHSYRLTNIIDTTGENTVYLYIDGRRIAPMTAFYLNSENQDTVHNQWNGQDIFINYIGCIDQGINDKNINNIKIWESIHNENHTHELIFTQNYELSCTEDERTEYVCQCGYYEADITKKATGHQPSEWITAKEPTETQEGIAVKKCLICGAVTEESIIPNTIDAVPVSDKVFAYVKIMIIPLLIIIMGIIFSKPKLPKINKFIGYRTKLSMKNEDTWITANRLIGKIHLFTGIAMLVASSLSMIPFINKSADTINFAVLVTTLIQVVIIIITIIPVEVRLRKTFDEDGNRK